MKVRYKTEKNGLKEVARVYSEDEHKIDYSKIDQDAVYVIKKLLDNGFESYLVGGAVRDLYLGKVPKDFDVVTEASPRQIHRIFKNSRVIGRRFRLVHVVFGDKIIEVSTFRSTEDQDLKNDNKFGSIEEDAKRRDFSINSLYYNIENHTLLDFNCAISDFKEHKITSLIPVSRTFLEDPVRMIRAIKYSVTTGFALRHNIRRSIKRFAPALANISSSRMTEELNKILLCGHSYEILSKLHDYKLLAYVLPSYCPYIGLQEIRNSLQSLDSEVLEKKNSDNSAVPLEKAFLALFSPMIVVNKELSSPNEVFKDIFRQVKVLISPNTPPNYQLEAAVKEYMKINNLKLPKPPVKRQPKKTDKEQNISGYKKRKQKKSED